MTQINDTIANAIVNKISGESEGNFNIFVEINENMSVEVEGWFEVDGYDETGGFVTTYARVCITDYTVTTFNEDGDEVENSIYLDTDGIEHLAEIAA